MNKPTGAVALVPKTKPGNSGRVVRYLKWPIFRKNQITENCIPVVAGGEERLILRLSFQLLYMQTCEEFSRAEL